MASGDILANFRPQDSEPTSSNFATPSVRNGHPTLLFDAATDESTMFSAMLPPHYDGGGITATLVWSAATATSNNTIWDAAFERIQDDVTDLDSDSFAAVQSVTATAPSASGETSYDDITFTDGAQMDSLAASEAYRLKITRDADNASDTMVGDAELISVMLTET
jgi:hypothetical protein